MLPLRFGPLALCVFLAPPLRAEEPGGNLRDDARKALKTAATFYRTKAASHGGYVYYYSPDLKERWGEGAASADTIFVQPPGTPTVGTAYLRAYEATGDGFYLDAARETARALVYGQLESGGWTQVIHFARANRMGKYRNGKGGNWNASSLDDGQTQAALVTLMRTDRALDFKHKEIHEAVTYGLDRLLGAQFRNGGFPQVWTKDVVDFLAVPAKYPDYDWKTEGRVKNYWDYPTLNDGLAGTVADVLVEAHLTYKDAKYKAALEKLGDFLILAQMPDPQPGWCQQYSQKMVPIWARKFEPPAITGWESQDAMRTLVKIARHTGERKYLAPIPRALAYFNKSLLEDGKVARFYELKTNKPLYMNARYELTYDDSAAPAHYGWKQPARFKEIEKEYEDARADRAPEAKPRTAKELEADVRRVLKELDAEGRWVSVYAGERLVGQPKFAREFRYISSAVFSANVETLSAYIAAK
ncbi:MAG: pectic acid lyase [Planctomycetes bacterium]|nr:pectic acid lyase [Planctomycetota bacterium]